MTNSVQFNVGDRVVCVDGWEKGFNGEEGTVLGFWAGQRDPSKFVVQVKFDNHPRVKEWYSYRFELVDPTTIGLSPICRKIRQMEKRWLNYQQRKTA